MAKLEKMLKKDLIALVKELQAQQPVDNKTTESKKEEEKVVKVLYINNKTTKQKLHMALMSLVYGCKPTKKVGKQLMDQDITRLIDYLKEVENFQIEYRNFFDIPEKQRVKLNLHPKFPTFIYKRNK